MSSGNILGAFYQQLPMGIKDIGLGEYRKKIPWEGDRSNIYICLWEEISTKCKFSYTSFMLQFPFPL